MDNSIFLYVFLLNVLICFSFIGSLIINNKNNDNNRNNNDNNNNHNILV